MRKLRRVWNSMQVSPRIVAMIKMRRPVKFEKIKMIIIKRIKIANEIFV